VLITHTTVITRGIMNNKHRIFQILTGKIKVTKNKQEKKNGFPRKKTGEDNQSIGLIQYFTI